MAYTEFEVGLAWMGKSVTLAKRFSVAVLLATVFPAIAAAAPKIDTLPKALSDTYVDNPQLRAERSRQRVTDEQVPAAISGWRPTITTTGSGGVQRTEFGIAGAPVTPTAPGGGGGSSTVVTPTTPATATITLTQPLFTGFQTLNQYKTAKENVKAGAQTLLAVEQSVLLAAATSYMNVLRDREINALRKRDVEFLLQELRAARARFDVGEITRTDVEQAIARLSLSRSEAATTLATLQSSVASFVQFVGRDPGRRMKVPPLSRRMPKSLRRAIAIADRLNPTTLAAVHTEQALLHTVKVNRGLLLPQIALQGTYTFSNDPATTLERSEVGILQGTFSIPIYQAGSVYSQIRASKHAANQQRLTILDSRRQVRQTVVVAWSLFKEAEGRISAFRAQVKANKIALDGLKQEALVGTRTTLDILDGEEELVAAQINLATAKRDRIVQAYEVIAAIGKMTASQLGLKVALYDPAENLRKVKFKAFGADVDLIE